MAIRPNTVLVNGFNLGALGLVWSERTGWRNSPTETIVTHQLPGDVGVTYQGSYLDKPRTIRLSGNVIASTMSGLHSNLDQVKGRLLGRLDVRFDDQPGIRAFGYVKDFDVRDIQPGTVVPTAPFVLEIECPDPRKFSVSATSVGAGVDCPLGTAPVRPVVTITGAASNPTIRFRDNTGATVSEFTMTGSLGGGQTWEIDSELGVITANGITNAVSAFSGALPVMDPAVHADFASSAWPDFVVSAGSAASLSIDYSRAWR